MTDSERIVVEQICAEASATAYRIQCGVEETLREWRCPSVLFRPRLSLDGNQWCALYGDDLMSGVAGFGDSPGLAMAAFDIAWCTKISEAR